MPKTKEPTWNHETFRMARAKKRWSMRELRKEALKVWTKGKHDQGTSFPSESWMYVNLEQAHGMGPRTKQELKALSVALQVSQRKLKS